MSIEDQDRLLGKLVREKKTVQTENSVLYQEIGRLGKIVHSIGMPLSGTYCDAEGIAIALKGIDSLAASGGIEKLKEHAEQLRTNLQRLKEIDQTIN